MDQHATRPVALVVGGAGGIGTAVCKRLRGDGYAVAVLDRSLGHDASDEDHVKAFVGDLESRIGHVQVLVCLAGRTGSGGIGETSKVAWDAIVNDNLGAMFVPCHVIAPAMRARGTGSIIAVASVNARTGGTLHSGPAYGAAKAGVIALVRFMARELAPAVRVNAIAPGPVDTPMLHRLGPEALSAVTAALPLQSVIAPEEIAEAVAYLASPGARNITGAVLDINGGAWMG